MKKACIYLLVVIGTACNVEKRQEALVKELIQVDLAFSELSRTKGMNNAFISYCAREGVLLRENAMPLEGAASIASMLSLSDDKSFILTWKPLHAYVAKSGDLGYTYGTFTLEIKETGEQSRGSYVSIWIKEQNSWKWVLDSGNQGLGQSTSSL